MKRSLFLTVILLLLVVFAFPIFYSADYSQDINTTDQKVNYDLPYPGLLPDSPLYIVKAARDRMLEFSTRDDMKKAELYLLLSDKRAEMANMLFDKGKDKLAITTLSKGEKYFLKIPDLLTQSKKQGVKYSDEFLFKVKKSNMKHNEIINQLMKKAPQGDIEALQQILEYNLQIKQKLNSL